MTRNGGPNTHFLGCPRIFPQTPPSVGFCTWSALKGRGVTPAFILFFFFFVPIPTSGVPVWLLAYLIPHSCLEHSLRLSSLGPTTGLR